MALDRLSINATGPTLLFFLNAWKNRGKNINEVKPHGGDFGGKKSQMLKRLTARHYQRRLCNVDHNIFFATKISPP